MIGVRELLSAPVGAQAEAIVLPGEAVARAPRAATPAEASTLPLNGLTAVQALALLALEPGDTLLVTGAAGAVGGFAVQLAALRELHVVAVAAAGDEALVRGLGAATFVERAQPLGAAVRAAVPGGVDGAIHVHIDRVHVATEHTAVVSAL